MMAPIMALRPLDATPPPRPTVRPAAPADAAAIAAIYNEQVLNGVATFDTEEKSAEDRARWMAGRGPRHAVLVVELDGTVLGFGSLNPWSERRAYDESAEASVYLAPEARGRGLGRSLLAALLAAGREAGLHTVIARITAGNEASLRLFRGEGFRDVGVLREVGRKHGRRLDVEVLQIVFDEGKTT